MNREPFATGEFYHVYNRGVDKRRVFMNREDSARFHESMSVFNTRDPVGSLYEYKFNLRLGRNKNKKERLVDIVCYCLNPNHYHFILRQGIDGGISEYMRRLGGGYTMYFNTKYRRSGSLFQGRYKSTYLSSNEKLLYTSAYVNLNDRVHRFGGSTSKSSWGEYAKGSEGICSKKIILDQFKSAREYKDFAEDTLVSILENKQLARELEDCLLE